jgi:crotonobetainyl-CoA:carnitine CoA-transferase CaiB-like acyl-CoA transferase
VTAPLAGLRVLELARILAGPWAGQTLADLGATVIKAESPEGDDTRTWGPPFVERGKDRSAAYFHACNRGKYAVAVDFTDPEDLALVRRLAADADVVIENFKVGGLAKYGLDWASLSAANPRLVYCSITGFGQDGPLAARPGYDFLIQGMSGLMSVTGAADGPPTKVGVAVTDIFTGLYAVIGIQAALAERARTGRGQQVDLALLDSAVGILANQAMNWLVTGRAPGRLGNAHPNIVPYEGFAVADGHVIVAVGNDAQWGRLCGVLGRADLAADPGLATNAGRVAARATLVPRLAAAMAGWRQAELIAALEGAGVPCGPINDIGAAFAEPQVAARGMAIAPEDVPGVRTPLRFSASGLSLARAAPARDADGAAIRERGWAAAEEEPET